MAGTITVKGIGKVSVKPDYVVLSMTLKSEDINYDKAMEIAATSISQLNDTMCGIGFEKDSVKTVDFDVRAVYDSVENKKGEYKSVFRGYNVTHELKLSFDLDLDKLSETLSAIAGCPSSPHLSVSFTVKDATAVSEEILRLAADNARKKAEILCEASGVKLGDLVDINYSWGEIDIYSDTDFRCEEIMPATLHSISFAPDDIDVSDTATFRWEIR